ncbi:uncharacterized protein [Drosophila kikkawai]|uniref:Uncharacterized protein n=1 Tax=Drosophila kikkawai TaxID=30033 RepID=A0ABM4GFQ8_DROKI
MRMKFLNTDKKADCKCGETIARLDKMIVDLTELVSTSRAETKVADEVHALRADQKVTQDKIEVLVEASSEQTATVKGMTKQQGERQKVASKFPVQTVGDLIDLNSVINIANRELCIDAIKNIIVNGGILKNLRNLMANEVVLAYNIDGVQGKAALRKEIDFYGVMIDSINAVGGIGSAEDQLREALQLQKKRHFKNSSMRVNYKNQFQVAKTLVDLQNVELDKNQSENDRLKAELSIIASEFTDFHQKFKQTEATAAKLLNENKKQAAELEEQKLKLQDTVAELADFENKCYQLDAELKVKTLECDGLNQQALGFEELMFLNNEMAARIGHSNLAG